MENWIEVCRLEDIPPLGARVVSTVAGDIAVFRNQQDRVFALHDRCPHRGGPLSQGLVTADSVTCPLHGWQIGLEDGQALAPDQGQSACIGVRLDQRGGVWITPRALTTKGESA